MSKPSLMERLMPGYDALSPGMQNDVMFGAVMGFATFFLMPILVVVFVIGVLARWW